ncbi:DMT family transporter [Aestuariivita sp.]|jgi:drug/metabolite transporter (DMT)-like permease|uniref:DMT family transporter n=1 Tax=Aestuariivita sp. TaxID=1872407 RepID=UPI00216CC7E0|nr:DMT family transporter [Aestuariivita sp.]MCE8007733.1 DMT family transporter [Aestuariivita sp.]
MRLILLTTLTMIAFAANSVLNRMALVDGGIDPAAFGAFRLIAGAAILWLLVMLTGGGPIRGAADWRAAVALFAYMFGFSFAYLALDAGIGALILFGMVQITMFVGALGGGERPPARRWIGAGIAFAGLTWLLWPGGTVNISLIHAAYMCVAGIGWGLYSLLGRSASDPLRATAANFMMAVPFGVALALVLSADQLAEITGRGLVLAGLSGAVTSGLGYALWYRVLPHLSASVAAVAQLSVPVIAMAAGVVFLAEPLGAGLALPALLVLGGVAISVLPRQKAISSKGS